MLDKGLLESALFRPQAGYYNDLAEMAAALFESLIMNHAFVDGNKRVAFFATDVFLCAAGSFINSDRSRTGPRQTKGISGLFAGYFLTRARYCRPLIGRVAN